MPTLLEQILTKRDAAQATRDKFLNLLTERMKTAATPDDAKLTTEEEAEYRAALGELRGYDERLPELRDQVIADHQANAARQVLGMAAMPNVRVTREPLTYEKHSNNSWFRDVARALEPSIRDEQSADRLKRHAKEYDTLVAEASPEQRANMNRTDGTGGEFVPPLWLMNQYLPIARAGRVTAELCRKLPLPAGTDSINLPSIATGSTVAMQTSDGAAASNTDMTTSSVSAGVKTAAGQQVIALQLLDQSPVNMDEIIFADLLADHAMKVDVQVIKGTGANGQVTGITIASSTNSITYTDASPTVPEMYPKAGSALNEIHTNRFLAAQAWVMHPRRWWWMCISLDSSNRPLVVPNAQGPANSFAGFGDVRAEGSVGTFLGLPVYVDANIPTDLGAGTEDTIIAARFDDLYLYEGPIRTRTLFETDAGTLQVRFQLYSYLAFMPHRYPKSISKIGGTGLIAPTF